MRRRLTGFRSKDGRARRRHVWPANTGAGQVSQSATRNIGPVPCNRQPALKRISRNCSQRSRPAGIAWHANAVPSVQCAAIPVVVIIIGNVVDIVDAGVADIHVPEITSAAVIPREEGFPET